jgi:hypothetical protein
VNQLLCEENAPGLRHRYRRRAEMLNEQSPKVAFPDAQPDRERFHARIVSIERAFRDQRQRAGDCVRSSPPGSQIRGRFRTATKAWMKVRFLRCRGREPKNRQFSIFGVRAGHTGRQ